MLLALFTPWVSSQSFTTENYYIFPINPGKVNYLAGTMGEMRGTHFHGGIDIRTGGKENLPVYAVADGYISRIRIQTGGYGHSLYVKHPNGTTSVYAHLNKFAPHVERYVVGKQYEEESYEISLFPESGEFSFQQGEIIGLSGNTGSSSGPHLHFEIRDYKQRVLDPLRFGFEEVTDKIPPILRKVAFVTLESQARVNGAFGRYEFDVILIDGKYTISKPIELKGKIGIETLYYDKHNGSNARNGVAEINLLIEGDTVFQQVKTTLSFAEMSNILVHMDYPAYIKGRQRFNKLFVDDGNTLPIYRKRNKGIHFDQSSKKININFLDSYGNLTQFNKNVNQRKIVYPISPVLSDFEVIDNYLHIEAETSEKEPLEILIHGKREFHTPYLSKSSQFYILDLRKGLPDIVMTPTKVFNPNFQSTVPSGKAINYDHKDFNITFSKRTLFDTLYLRYDKEVKGKKEHFRFLHKEVPLRRAVKIALKPELQYTKKAHVYSIEKEKVSYLGGEWKGEEIHFQTKQLVTFTVKEDSIPPIIKPIKISSNQLIISIDDDLSGIGTYRATLNGKWLLMKYDAKKKKIVSKLDSENKLIEGEFILKVLDNAGNERVYQKTITKT